MYAGGQAHDHVGDAGSREDRRVMRPKGYRFMGRICSVLKNRSSADSGDWQPEGPQGEEGKS